ncbi:MAG TPA: hypothetical protein PLP42_13710 [Acidobacteriota bacterium]|nr:hypothetical protein [Acidobacteriota bacterium]
MKTLFQRCPLLFLFINFHLAVASTSGVTFRFDMGTEQSPVKKGFIKVDPTTSYSQERGYGWLGRYQSADVTPAMLDRMPAWQEDKVPGHMGVWYYLRDGYDELTRDVVFTPEPVMRFRVDVPNGRYVVRITIGDFRTLTTSIAVYANDRLLAYPVDARHLTARGPYGGHPDAWWGWYKVVSGEVEVNNGQIVIQLKGDNTRHEELLAKCKAMPVAGSWLVGQSAEERFAKTVYDRRLKEIRSGRLRQMYAGAPFSQNAVMSLSIYPAWRHPVTFTESGQMTKSADITDAEFQRGVEAFNQSEFDKAAEHFRRAESADSYDRAIALLWVAGHPNNVNYLDVVKEAIRLLDSIPPDHTAFEAARDQREMAERFLHLRTCFDERNQVAIPGIPINSYYNLIHVEALLSAVDDNSPLIRQAKLITARGLYMADPHRWGIASALGRQYLQDLEKSVPDNRFVKLYLEDKWEPHGEWSMKDISLDDPDAPEWAVAFRKAYSRTLEFIEWWIENKQREDGSLGGGWGDDVELVPLFGWYSLLSSDASPISLEGTRKLVNGVYHCSEIDQEGGFFAGLGDNEHTGEYTGDSQSMMVWIDYGNPVYFERCLKIAKLMRDLWSGINNEGHRHMKSIFFGAGRIGLTPELCNDHDLNGRVVSPAFQTALYNNNPTVTKLFLEWADAWVHAAEKTEKGKPFGVIPSTVGYQTGTLGGTGSDKWYELGSSVIGSGPHWPKYQAQFIRPLLVWAYRLTGNFKYLRPFKIQADIAREHDPAVRMPEVGSRAWIAQQLHNIGSIEFWESIERELLHTKPYEFPKLPPAKAIEAYHRMDRGYRERWPFVTTEALATDRVFIPGGFIAPLENATGMSKVGGMMLRGAFNLAFTYRNTTRDFAAHVLGHTDQKARLLLYSFANESRSVAVRPWLLQIGGRYSLTCGIDRNQDGEIEEIADRKEFDFRVPGQSVWFELPARVQAVIEIELIESGEVVAHRPDLALTSDDLEIGPAQQLMATVHNIGSAAAKEFQVIFFEGDPNNGGKEIGWTPVSFLAPPNDLTAQKIRVGIDFRTAETRDYQVFVKVVSDPSQEEITLENN